MPDLPSIAQIAKMIDHSLLHPTLTDAQLDAGCRLSAAYEVATACVKPYHVPRATELLAGTGVAVCSVIGFPHGNNHTSIKVLEAELAIREGATEIDMVVNAGRFLSGARSYVTDDIKQVNDACREHGAILKVIFENDFLTDDQVVQLCVICSEIGVAFVKTSTGYGLVKQPSGEYNYAGATDRHLGLMRANCPPSIQIKAAGGVRTLDDVLRVRALGVSRIGATATEAILKAAQSRGLPGPAPRGLTGAVGSKAVPAPAGY
jgi:deoxyribose-phosphate aldolase